MIPSTLIYSNKNIFSTYPREDGRKSIQIITTGPSLTPIQEWLWRVAQDLA
jgi:hypothetical protein